MNYLKGSCQKDEFVTVAVSTAAAAVIRLKTPLQAGPGTNHCFLVAVTVAWGCGQGAPPEAQACSVCLASWQRPGCEMHQDVERCAPSGLWAWLPLPSIKGLPQPRALGSLSSEGCSSWSGVGRADQRAEHMQHLMGGHTGPTWARASTPTYTHIHTHTSTHTCTCAHITNDAQVQTVRQMGARHRSYIMEGEPRESGC